MQSALAVVLEKNNKIRVPLPAELDLFCTVIDRLWLMPDLQCSFSACRSYEEFCYRFAPATKNFTAFDLVDFYSRVARHPNGINLLAGLLKWKCSPNDIQKAASAQSSFSTNRISFEILLEFIRNVQFKIYYTVTLNLARGFELLSGRNISLYWSYKIGIISQIWLFVVSNRKLVPIPPYLNQERMCFSTNTAVNLRMRFELNNALVDLGVNELLAFLITILTPCCFLEGASLDQLKYNNLRPPNYVILTQMALLWDLRILAVLDKWRTGGCQVIVVSHSPFQSSFGQSNCYMEFEAEYADCYIENNARFNKSKCQSKALMCELKNPNFNIIRTSAIFRMLDYLPACLSRRTSIGYFLTFFEKDSLEWLSNHESRRYVAFLHRNQPLIMSELNTLFGSSFFVRPHPWERRFKNYSDVMTCRQLASELGVAISDSSLEYDLTAKLLIFDHFTSSIYDALACRAPFILLIPSIDCFTRFSDQNHIVSVLDNAGLLFCDVDSMICFLSSDYESHIASGIVRSAYSHLRKLYCKPALNHSQMVLSLWKQCLKSSTPCASL